MTVDIRRFAFALASAAWNVLCALPPALAPDRTSAVFSFAMQYDQPAVADWRRTCSEFS